MGNPYEMDITEIHGFDDLHHAEGILAELQARAAKMYGADTAYALINGSTCGILAAICAAAEPGETILMARNCHKSVYHAVEIQGLHPLYLYPHSAKPGIQGQICPEQVEAFLKQNAKIRAVVLTSPTYDGILSDIETIAKIVHAYEIPLIVDEAHGAHLGLAEDWPQNAIALGADAVIVSIHKTLPAFTQTALLLTKGQRIEQREIVHYLDIFETSSPSYVLMAGIDRCIRIMSEKGTELLAELRRQLDLFYEKTKGLCCLSVLRRGQLTGEEAFDFDDSKILIFTGQSGADGPCLAQILREKYGIEVEMACKHYVLALCTVMDTEEGFARLAQALREIDCKLLKEREECLTQIMPITYHSPERAMPIAQIRRCPSVSVSWDEIVGCVSTEYVIPYPPGIPLIVPGEQIDEKIRREILSCREAGITLEGMEEPDRLRVLVHQKL